MLETLKDRAKDRGFVQLLSSQEPGADLVPEQRAAPSTHLPSCCIKSPAPSLLWVRCSHTAALLMFSSMSRGLGEHKSCGSMKCYNPKSKSTGTAWPRPPWEAKWLLATPRTGHGVWLSLSIEPSVLRSQQAFKSCPNSPKSIIMGRAWLSLFYCFRFKCIPH